MSHVCMSEVTRIKESCHTYVQKLRAAHSGLEIVLIKMNEYVTRMSKSCLSYALVMSHV